MHIGESLSVATARDDSTTREDVHSLHVDERFGAGAVVDSVVRFEDV